jgi:type IV pilus assembly protein PilO
MEKLLDRIAKAPLGMKVAVVAAAVALVTLLNYFVVSVPRFGPSVSEIETKLQKAQIEQKRLDTEYIEKTSIANNLNQFRREKEVLEQRLREAIAELPEDKNIEDLLQLFQDRAQKAGLEISTIEPREMTVEGFYARIPIPMEVQGNFHEIATFFDSLGRLRRIVNVSDIKLDSPKDANGKIVLKGKFLVTTFMFVNAASAKAPPPSVRGKR